MGPAAGNAPASSALQKRRDYLSIHAGVSCGHHEKGRAGFPIVFGTRSTGLRGRRERGGPCPTHDAASLSTASWVPPRSCGSPRCCPVLCGLRDRCIAAMLVTRKPEAGGHAPHSTEWNDLFSKQSRCACPVQLPLIGRSGRIRTCT